MEGERDHDENVAGEKQEPTLKKTPKKDSKTPKLRGNVVSDAELQKSGVIYLSRIPTLMNKDILRQYFCNFGDVGRIWLELDTKVPQRGKRMVFAEGWVEFKDKKVAKRVATCLNNTQVGGKKRYAWSEEIWNIKYLNRFKWVHLHERLAYEKAVHQQRMRTEISQVKRETNFYIENAEKSEYERRKRKKTEKLEETMSKADDIAEPDYEELKEKTNNFELRVTEDEIVGQKRKHSEKSDLKSKKGKRGRTENTSKSKSFLSKIFSASS